MKFNEFKHYLHTHSKNLLDQYLKPDKKKKGYICPVCGNGTGSDGDGIREDPNSPGHYKCFKCGFYGDVIDIVGEHELITDNNEKIKRTKEIFHLDLNKTENVDLIPIKQNLTLEEKRVKALQKENSEFKELIKKASFDFFTLGYCIYLDERGISFETALKAKVGYIENFKGIAKGLVFYTTEAGINVRNIYPECSKKDRYRKAGVDLPFNILDIKRDSNEPLYIVEGEIDALSFLEIGYEAVSLNGLGREALISALKHLNIKRPLLLMLDEDEAGKKAQTQLFEELKKNNFIVYQSKILEGRYKDANDYLCKNKYDFKNQIRKEVKKYSISRKISETNDILFNSNSFNVLEKFKADVHNHNTPVAISTGFLKLDEEYLDGGLYEGLYIIGAASSTGKTSFVLQMSDYIANQGRDVMILSLEMSAINLIAKSMSRLSFLYENKENSAFSTREILNAGQNFSNLSIQNFNSLAETYQKQINKNLTIIEENYDISVDEIEDILISYNLEKKEYPVLIIDYFQILPPPSSLKNVSSDKKNLDYNIDKLKKISKKYKIPIILISSFNRESYRNNESSRQINYASFNGSSNIEYRADVLISLETVEDDQTENYDQLRYLKLKVLKNRNGKSDKEIIYRYYPKYNYFEEIEKINKVEKKEIFPEPKEWEWPYEEYERFL